MMNKQFIKERYSNYCDTDKLVDDMMALLTKYGHRNSEHGVCTILDEFFTNKKPLIEMLMQSSNYKGDLRVIRKEIFARDCVESDIRSFISGFRKAEGIKQCIIKYKDENGKTVHDYIRTGTRNMNLKQMTNARNLLNSEEVKKFDLYTGATRESCDKLRQFNYWMDSFNGYNKTSLQSEWSLDGVKCGSGMKTSRAFNKVCAHYGVDKWDKYNKEFAKYADMVSGKDREMQFIISVNPLDYLTMSFGKSWASCHTIDKRNVRRMENGYSGAYCNGTLSYMMDGSSIITYVLDEIEENIHEQGKVYRNMFHVNINSQLCIQGRIYPQGNDGSTDLYKKFRTIIQDELTPLFGLKENKWKSRSVSSNDASSVGYHYQDYYNYSSCKTFYPSAKEGQTLTVVKIGHLGICPRCGKEYRSSEYLSHDYDCEIPEESHTETEVTSAERTLNLTVNDEMINDLNEAIRNANASTPERFYELVNGSHINIATASADNVNRRNFRNIVIDGNPPTAFVYGSSVRGRSQIVDDAGNSIVDEDLVQRMNDYINQAIHEEFTRVANGNRFENVNDVAFIEIADSEEQN